MPQSSPAVAGGVEVSILGSVTAHRRGDAVPLRGVSSRTVLARLALDRGRSVTVHQLSDALWDDAPPARSSSAIQSTVSRLRAGLGADAIVHEGGGYRLAEHVATDLDTVLTLVDAAAASPEATEVAALLGRALTVFRGEPLADVAPTIALDPERARLGELRATIIDQWFAARLDGGQDHLVVAELEREAKANPWRESLQILLMRALGGSGRVAEALRVAAEHRRRMVESSGLDPSPALVAVERSLLDGSVEGPPRTPAPSAGMQRRTWRPPDDRMVGRAAEMSELRELVERRRLVTVVGPGGVGKTRLAMELVAATPDVDTVVVELAAVAPGGDVAAALAGELDLQASGPDLVSALAERLELFDSLLVLDNAEHVLEPVRDLVELLLRRSSTIRVALTSRRRLGLAEEQVLRLDPLPVPTSTDPDQPAVQLLLDRVSRSDATFASDAATDDDLDAACEIGRLLDGIPLAIELAARRVPVLGLPGLRDRLARDSGVLAAGSAVDSRRQATLEAAISWSYDLLSPSALIAAEELAVFPDRFDLAAAEAVLSTAEPLSDVAELVDSSMLLAEHGAGGRRFRMLEPVRQVARARLAATGRDVAVADAHADWVVAAGDRLETRWMDDDASGAHDVLRSCRSDVLVAIEHLRGRGRQADVDRLARQIGLVLLEHPDVAFSELIPSVTGSSLDGVAGRALIGSAGGRPRPGELHDLLAALEGLRPDDPRRHLLRFAAVPAQQYQGEIDAAVATCTDMLADPETPLRFQVLAVAMWALVEGLMGRFEVAEAVLEDHRSLLERSAVGGFVAYARAEVAAGTDIELALAHLDEAVDRSAAHPRSFVHTSAQVLRLSLLVRVGRWDQARELVRRLAPELLAAGTLPQAWRALRSTAIVLIAAGDHRTGVRILETAALDPRAPIVLGHWNDVVGRQWELVTEALGDAEVAELRASCASVSMAELWLEVERALDRLD